MVKFSIVISARNEEEHIGRFLDSIGEGSEFDDYEVIVIDGGSTDDTKKIAEEKGAKVIQGPGKGLTESRNFGWKKANGEYIGLYDADEFFQEGYLDEVEKHLDGEVKAIKEGGVRVTEGWISKVLSIEADANLEETVLYRFLSKIRGLR